MHFIDLVRDWLKTEFPDLSIHVLSSSPLHDQIGEIFKHHKNVNLTYVVAYVTEDTIVFGPNWDIMIHASDPECFKKAKSLIQQLPYDEPYKPWMGL